MSDWQDHAACRGADPRIFYALTAEAHKEALTYCAECPVTIQCSILRVETEQLYGQATPGVWGGKRYTINENKSRHKAQPGTRNVYQSANVCRNGHARTPENTYTAPTGEKVCRTCKTEAVRRSRSNRRKAVNV